MHTTYHLESAEEINTDIIDSIKATYKNKPITIIVEEDESNLNLTQQQKEELDYRLNEDPATYITAEESLKRLNEKYGL